MPLSELSKWRLRDLLRDVSERCAALDNDAVIDRIQKWASSSLLCLWPDVQEAASICDSHDLSHAADRLRKDGSAIEDQLLGFLFVDDDVRQNRIIQVDFIRAVKRFGKYTDSLYRTLDGSVNENLRLPEVVGGDTRSGTAVEKEIGQTATNDEAPDGPLPTVSVNLRMLDTMSKKLESREWSARKWAEYLGCTKSSVAETNAWKSLMAFRGGVALDRIEADAKRHARERERQS